MTITFKSFKTKNNKNAIKTVKNNKNAIYKKLKANTSKQNYFNIGGDGILSSLITGIAHQVVQVPKKKNLSSNYPFKGYVNMLDPSRLVSSLSQSKKNLLEVIYSGFSNNKNDKIYINTLPKGSIISSNKLIHEPLIRINSNEPYYLAIHNGVRLYWLCIFETRAKSKVLLEYKPLRSSIDNPYTYYISLYKCPSKPIPDFKSTSITSHLTPNPNPNPRFIVNDILQVKRKEAYIKFMEYIKLYKLPLKLTLSFKVQQHLHTGIDLYNILHKNHNK